jgi:hypothetical protein
VAEKIGSEKARDSLEINILEGKLLSDLEINILEGKLLSDTIRWNGHDLRINKK